MFYRFLTKVILYTEKLSIKLNLVRLFEVKLADSNRIPPTNFALFGHHNLHLKKDVKRLYF